MGTGPPPTPGPSGFVTEKERGGCRRQHLWGQQLRLSPRADTELLGLRRRAQPRAPARNRLLQGLRQRWGSSPYPFLTPQEPSEAAKAAAMPHFLDWFVPVYLFISVLILVGFGACIYYFEPGLQEAHKWRMQRPLVDRDFRKTLMVRDNLAFGGPEV
ncbi:hypothetical protein M91_14873 [Bos mutus]|nr:hypothetical protein M91_14873 [Bos mutus]